LVAAKFNVRSGKAPGNLGESNERMVPKSGWRAWELLRQISQDETRIGLFQSRQPPIKRQISQSRAAKHSFGPIRTRAVILACLSLVPSPHLFEPQVETVYDGLPLMKGPVLP